MNILEVADVLMNNGALANVIFNKDIYNVHSENIILNQNHCQFKIKDCNFLNKPSKNS